MERFCSVTLADHLGSVMHNWKHDSCVKCPNSVKCKIDISVVFVVKGNLDSFMISGLGMVGWFVVWFGYQMESGGGSRLSGWKQRPC